MSSKQAWHIQVGDRVQMRGYSNPRTVERIRWIAGDQYITLFFITGGYLTLHEDAAMECEG